MINEVVSQADCAPAQSTVLAQIKINRYPLVDQLRGVAVVLMIIYHFAYNLTMYKYIPYSAIFDWPLFLVQRVCIISFLVCVGVSLCLVHANGIRWGSFARREVQVGGAALLVSLATYVSYSQSWVYFGILHFITTASLVALLFVRRPTLAGVVGLAILLPYWFWDKTIPWFTLSHSPFDYVPMFPWLAYVLLGIVAYHIGAHRWWCLPASQGARVLEFTGRHTLIIYLLHQPVLMAFVAGYYYLTLQ